MKICLLTRKKVLVGVDYDLLLNGSGYRDFTAYKAMKNVQGGESYMSVLKGEIYEYDMQNGNTRFAIVISSNERSNDRYLSVILLTEEEKSKYSVPVICKGKMHCDCAAISFCYSDRLVEFIRQATDDEMKKIDEMLLKSLGINSQEKVVEKTVEVVKEVSVDGHEQYPTEADLIRAEALAKARTEANIYKDLYENLLAKMIG